MKKTILLLLATSLLASCGSNGNSHSSETTSGAPVSTSAETSSGTSIPTSAETSSDASTATSETTEESKEADIKYTTLDGEGTYKFEVTNGHAYAKYTPKCTTDAHFYGEGAIFESEFISWVKIHPIDDLNRDIGDSGFLYDNYEEDYYFMSDFSVTKEYLNKEVIVDFYIDTNHMENGSKFELQFYPEDHQVDFTGECQCGYKCDKIYNFDFTKQIAITLEAGEEAYLKFDTPRDNFVLYFDTAMNDDDLSTGISGYTPHGDQYIRNSLYMVVVNQDKTLNYDTSGVGIQYINLINNSLKNITQTFTVSPR